MIEEDSSPIHYNDKNDGFSAPRKQRSQLKNKTKQITKNVSSSQPAHNVLRTSFNGPI